MSEIENGGLDQYGTEPFEQQQFVAAGIEGVNAEMLSQQITGDTFTNTSCAVSQLYLRLHSLTLPGG